MICHGASSISRSCPGNVPSLRATTLVGAGVAASNMENVGACESMPITNKTDAGRAEKRRVELMVLAA